jgi:hypothetical protein
VYGLQGLYIYLAWNTVHQHIFYSLIGAGMPNRPEPLTLQDCLQELIDQTNRQDRQWVQPLRRIQRYIEQGKVIEATQTWQSLLRPMRGSFHEFFICCDDLDQMRLVNIRIDHLRDRISDELNDLMIEKPSRA